MGRGPAFTRCDAGSNPAATTHGLEVFAGGMPDSYSVRRRFDSAQAHSTYCGIVHQIRTRDSDPRKAGSSPDVKRPVQTARAIPR
jgi:hypothetical protein